MFPFSAWIPNGAYPFAIAVSLNAFAGSVTGFHCASKTSTRPLWKSVA